MRPDPINDRAPGGQTSGNGYTHNTVSVSTGTDNGTDAAAFFRNCYAVLVRGKTVRRHLYFNLPAADRAVKRAQARGAAADMVLVRLVPVDARYLNGGEDVD